MSSASTYCTKQNVIWLLAGHYLLVDMTISTEEYVTLFLQLDSIKFVVSRDSFHGMKMQLSSFGMH